MKPGHLDSDQITGRHLDWQLFRRFLGRLRPFRRQAGCALALLPVVALLKLVQPYLVKVGIDAHIVPGDLSGLGGVALLFLLAVLGESLASFAQGYLVQAVGQRIMAGMRREGFARLLRLPVPFFDRHPSGRLVTRLTSDVENVGELFGAGVVAALGDLVTLAFLVAAMLWLNPALSLVAFSVLPLLFLIGWLFRRAMRGAMRRVRARLAGLNAYVAERISGIMEVRLFGQERRTLEEFAGLQRNYFTSTLQVINWDAALYALVEAVGAVAVAAVLWKGGGQVLTEVATFGTLVAFIEYVQKFFIPLRDLSAKFAVLQSSNASLERIFDLLDQPTEGQGAPPSPGGRGEVRFENVAFSYDGRHRVLEGIDLRLAPGETVALVGATGSGKSTLTRLLLRFYAPKEGRILLDGEDLAGLDPAALRLRIGWVPQEPFLFSGTLRENLDPDAERSDKELESLLARFGAGEVVARLGGLDARLGERGGNLSSGERQMLCLARALVPDPSILVLDEATSRLDAVTERRVQEGVWAALRGRTAVLVAHRLSSVVDADRIVVLGEGRIREEGGHRELLAREGIYARLWRLQALSSEETSG